MQTFLHFLFLYSKASRKIYKHLYQSKISCYMVCRATYMNSMAGSNLPSISPKCCPCMAPHPSLGVPGEVCFPSGPTSLRLRLLWVVMLFCEGMDLMVVEVRLALLTVAEEEESSLSFSLFCLLGGCLATFFLFCVIKDHHRLHITIFTLTF